MVSFLFNNKFSSFCFLNESFYYIYDRKDVISIIISIYSNHEHSEKAYKLIEAT